MAPAPFMVLTGSLVVHGLTSPGMEGWPSLTPGKECSSVYCARKNSYGCGKHGQKLVEGISLYVGRAGDPDLRSTLSICLSDEAIQSAQAELGVPGGLEVEGRIWIAHQQVLVLIVSFLRQHYSQRVYYLVYDSADASLYMMPCIPDQLQALYTMAPVPVRAADGRGHELALLARKRWPHRINRGRLCLSTPESRADITGPWEIKEHQFPEEELPQPFTADVLFSIEGKVFWADLSQGVVYSDLRTEGPAVESHPILLPSEFQIEYPDLLDTDEEAEKNKMPEVSRTMGSVDGCIKFVCIDSCGACPGDWTVKILTMDLHNQRWEDEKGFPCSWIELWKQVGLMNAELRDMEVPEPQYPVLMPDGALCIRLHGKQGLEEAGFICSFDMRTQRLTSFGRVQHYKTAAPLILPSDFFTKCQPPPPPRSKLPDALLSFWEPKYKQAGIRRTSKFLEQAREA